MATYPSINTINSIDLTFIHTTLEDRFSGDSRIQGKLITPIGDEADHFVIIAIDFLERAYLSPSPSPIRIAWAKRNLDDALNSRPAKFQHHQNLYDMRTTGFDALRAGSADGVDERIAQMERGRTVIDETDYLYMKNCRRIFLDGSLVAALDSELMWTAIKFARSGVLARPDTWEGYTIGLVSYAVMLINDQRDTMITYREKLQELGIDPKAARATNRKTWRELVREGLY